jgi:serine/threonine protein kinase
MIWFDLLKYTHPNLEPLLKRKFLFNVCFFRMALLIYFFRLLSPGALELSEALLSMDPSKRPTAADALQFDYFKSESPEPIMPAK